jgi:hypothetical protein
LSTKEYLEILKNFNPDKDKFTNKVKNPQAGQIYIIYGTADESNKLEFRSNKLDKKGSFKQIPSNNPLILKS